MARIDKNDWAKVAQLARNGARTTEELASADKLARFARFVARVKANDKRDDKRASLRD